MKLPRFKKENPTEAPAVTDEIALTINADAYEALPESQKAIYRPINPKYERLPIVCIVLYAVALVCLGLYIAMQVSIPFADWFNRTIGAGTRFIFSSLTAWIPFSVGEFVIWMIPLLLVVLLRYAIRCRCDTWLTSAVYIGILGSVAALLFSLFVLNFAAGYRGSTLDEKLDMDRRDVRAEELYDTAVILIQNINREAAEVNFYEKNFSAMPYDLATMNDHLLDAYDTFSASHDFVVDNPGRPKPVLASEVMSYMHITGVYSFFTGESNINVNFPDYTIPYTAAHEMAHQRGIAREDEANFVAFLVCIGADDPYIRYSAYVGVYEYVANALWSADRDLYYKALEQLDTDVRYEMIAYGEFYEKYRESTVSDISSSVNDTFLQIQGTPGMKSYGMVVDLAVAYYRD